MLVERPKDLVIAVMSNGIRYVGYPSENTMNTKEELTITGAVVVEEKDHTYHIKPITSATSRSVITIQRKDTVMCEVVTDEFLKVQYDNYKKKLELQQ